MKASMFALALALAVLVVAPATQLRAAPSDPALAESAEAGVPKVATSRPDHRSGGAALGIGIATTFAPAVLSVMLNSPGGHGNIAWEASLAAGAALGITIGPAVGLTSGGRGDLARRGLIVRGCGTALAGLGLYEVTTAMGNDAGTPLTVPLMLPGLVGGSVTVVSLVHDLAITPSAVNSPPHSVRIGLDERGRMAATVRF